MDFLQARKYKEWALVCLVGLATAFALLPPGIADQLSINRTYIAAILGILLVIALFLYLKFAFFIMVAVLVTGANVTDSWSDALGISKLPLIIALAAMVGISLINYVVSILPTGLEPKPREKSPEGIKAMFYAIEKDNLVYAQKVLAMGFDPNVLSENGYTPLQYAAMRGDPQMVELFLRNGASVNMLSKDGESAVELALKMDHGEAAEMLKNARQELLAQEQAVKAALKKE
jgi:ankyrin repeat protein